MANPLDGLSKTEDTFDKYARIGQEHEKAMYDDAMDKIRQGLPQRMLNEEAITGKPSALNAENPTSKMSMPDAATAGLQEGFSKLESMAKSLGENALSAVKESIKSSDSHEFTM